MTAMTQMISAVAVTMALWTGALGQVTPTTDLESIRQQIERGDSVAMKTWVQLPCDSTVLASESTIPKLSDSKRYAVIKVSSPACDWMSLVLFREDDRSRWDYVQTLVLSAKYSEPPEITFPELVTAGVQEVMVQHENVDWGSGARQKNTSIFKIVADRLTCVFDAAELVRYSYQRSSGGGISQSSKFTIERSSRTFKFPGVAYIREDQHLEANGTVLDRHRYCLWEENITSFRCFEAGSNPPGTQLHGR
jgi:hypothetical protein